jgi:aryl-alcohol dehydrogenase-like predicted oxidoreductase
MPQYTELGASGLKAPRLWLGAMMFGDQTAEPEARSIVAAARDAGVMAIDTSDNYASGESERLVGRLIGAERSRWIVATKVANPMGPDPNDRGLSRRWVLQEVEHSLRRLGTDWIDLYYMHRDDEHTPLEETLATFARLIDAGKIRYYGVSNFRAWRVARVVETARRMGLPPPVACQPPYSAVNRLIEAELLPCCHHYGLGVLAYSPLARGVLTGKYQPGQAAEPGTRAGRGDKRILQTEFRPESVAIAQRIAAHAAARGLTASQFAIAWALHNRLVHGVIGGPRTLAQWTDYLQGAAVALGPEDEAFVDGLVPPGYASTHGYNDPQYPLTGREARRPR